MSMFENIGKVWIDGEYKEYKDTNVPWLNQGLHYASAVFEGCRAYNGKIFELEKHTQRLLKSAEILKLETKFSESEINEACNKLLEINNLKEAYVRPIIWADSGNLGIPSAKVKSVTAIAVWHWGSYFDKELLNKGLRLTLSKWRRPDPRTAPTEAKASGLYMICSMSKTEAVAAGYDDALMLDFEGYIAESTGSNIFFIKGKEIHTPTADRFLNGITRQTIIKLVSKMGYEVIERRVKLDELNQFEECFITGSAIEVFPIGEIDDASFKAKDKALEIRENYLDLVKG